MINKIIKRNGELVNFEKNKIAFAVQKSWIETLGLNELEKAFKIGLNVAEYIQFLNKDNISVEEIQDLVITELYVVNTKVAHNYQNYRELKGKERGLK